MRVDNKSSKQGNQGQQTRWCEHTMTKKRWGESILMIDSEEKEQRVHDSDEMEYEGKNMLRGLLAI